MGTNYDLWLWTSSMSWERVLGPTSIYPDSRMAMLEIRLMVSILVMTYKSWTGVPDKPGEWDEEMKPYDSTVLHPRNNKCVLKFKQRI